MRQPATGITPNLGNCNRKIDRTEVQFSLVLWIFSVHRTEPANTTYEYHFVKVSPTDHCGGTLTYPHIKLQLFILINNNEVAVSSTCKLVQHLELPHFELRAIFEDLKKQPINSAICGLYGTNFPLWKLRELLDETWVGEDVLNGLAELLYFHQAAESTSVNPPFLYLQTSFFTDAHCLHKQHPMLFSQEVLELRQHLFNTNVLKIGIQACDSDHYSTYVTSANAVKFDHGDTMHNPPLADALQVFQWAFKDIPVFSQERIDSEQVACQGHGNGGDSSSGLAAFNFVE